MAMTREEREKRLIDDLRSHGGESFAEFGEEFLKMDSDEKLATTTLIGLKGIIPTLDRADMKIIHMALTYLMKKEPSMCGLLCISLNEAIETVIKERHKKETDTNEQESN